MERLSTLFFEDNMRGAPSSLIASLFTSDAYTLEDMAIEINFTSMQRV